MTPLDSTVRWQNSYKLLSAYVFQLAILHLSKWGIPSLVEFPGGNDEREHSVEIQTKGALNNS